MITERTQQGPTRFWSQTGDEKPESRWFVVFVLLMPSLFFRCYLRLLVCHFGPQRLERFIPTGGGPAPAPGLAGAAVESPATGLTSPPTPMICDPSCQQRCVAADGRVQSQFSSVRLHSTFEVLFLLRTTFDSIPSENPKEKLSELSAVQCGESKVDCVQSEIESSSNIRSPSGQKDLDRCGNNKVSV